MERYTGVSAAEAPAAAKRAKATAEQPQGRAGGRAARAAEASAVARRGPVMSAQELSDAALLVQKQIDAAKQAQQPEPQPEPEPPSEAEKKEEARKKSLRKRNKKRAD